MQVINWLSFVKDFGIPYTPPNGSSKVTENYIGVKCPFHPDHRGDNLGLNLKYGTVNCWHDGKHKPIETIEALLSVSNSEARTIYRKYIGTDGVIKGHKAKRENAKYLTIPESTKFTPNEYKYINSRGLSYYLDNDMVDIRSGGLTGLFAHRLVFPIYFGGEPVSATGRTVCNVDPKYYTLKPELELISHKTIFNGWDDLESEETIVVEGPIDSIKGGPGFISSFGSSLSDEQLLLLSTRESVKFLFDADLAGKKVYNYANYISLLGVTNVEVLWLPSEYKDVGALSLEEVGELRNSLGLKPLKGKV